MPPQARSSAAAKIVDDDLQPLMTSYPEAARRHVAPDLQIRFTGGRTMRDPAECTALNASRYRGVKKRVQRTETVAGGTDDHTVVYSRGTLYGERPDGAPFEGNRYVDRRVVRADLITQMDVWNDSAEWLIDRCGLGTADHRAAAQ